MAVSGVKLNLPKDSIIAALKESKGVVYKAAERLNISGYTLRKKIKEHPDIVEFLAELRNDFENTILDMAENCILVSISRLSEDPSNALRASMYTLNSRGKERHWNNTFISEQKAVSQVDYQNLQMENSALREKLGIHNESETKPILPGSDTPI